MQLFNLAAHHVESDNIDVCRHDLENDGVEIAQARHKVPREVNHAGGVAEQGYWLDAHSGPVPPTPFSTRKGTGRALPCRGRSHTGAFGTLTRGQQESCI